MPIFEPEKRGAVAQLGERLHGMQEVGGSNPLRSTKRACAVSSEVEHFLDVEGVGGSNPPLRTIFFRGVAQYG